MAKSPVPPAATDEEVDALLVRRRPGPFHELCTVAANRARRFATITEAAGLGTW
jgi:hypothetical protein